MTTTNTEDGTTYENGGGTTGEHPSWEYRPVRLPPGISRLRAATQLSIHAEYAGWELSRVSLYADGTRKVWLCRRRTADSLPEPAL